MDKKKYPTSYEKEFIGQEVITEYTPEYLRKVSDEALFDLLMKANNAYTYYTGSGHAELANSISIIIDEIYTEQQNRMYDNRIKEEARLRQKAKLPDNSAGVEFEFGAIEKTKNDKDDW